MNFKNPGGALADVPIRLTQNMANNQARVDPNIFRCTMNAIPCNEELLKKSRLPFGLTLHPFRDMKVLVYSFQQTSNFSEPQHHSNVDDRPLSILPYLYQSVRNLPGFSPLEVQPLQSTKRP